WKKDLSDATEALHTALGTKGGAGTEKKKSAAALREAHAEFVSYYNGVVKPSIAGLLADVGRSVEYKLYFKDFQVHESPKPKKPSEQIVAILANLKAHKILLDRASRKKLKDETRPEVLELWLKR